MAEPPGKERRENKNNQHVNRRHDDTRLENLHVFPTRAYKFEKFPRASGQIGFLLKKIKQSWSVSRQTKMIGESACIG